MLAERLIINADALSKVLTLPKSFLHRNLEVVVWPIDETLPDAQYNDETVAALTECTAILDGTIDSPSYATVEEMNIALDAETYNEEQNTCSL
jgi:hypothetical protein